MSPCLLCLLLALPGISAFAATVENVRLWRAPDHTRLVFDLSSYAEHRVFPLANPDRLVIDIDQTDLKNSTVKTSLENLKLDDTPIQAVRSGIRDGNNLRIVLDLRTSVSPRSFPLKKNEQYGDRLVVDLYDIGQATEKTVDDFVDQQNGQRDIIVAIDAGHGGEDPGAIGPGRVQEKNVVLAISRALKKRIDQERGFKAVLVRTGDYYIPLRDRTTQARKERADLFVSIHADAFKRASANGASVFALSRRGATSETARYLAQRENRADLIGGVGSVSLNDKDQMLASVLLDLSMTATLSSSLEVGEEVLRSVGGVARLHKKQVEQAGFLVLKSPDIPSILVETGFISNPTEARHLSDRHYQTKMAEAIFSGVRRYFHARPPVGTLLAANSIGRPKEYVIGHGDTLSDIAQRYNVSVDQIVRHNGLKSTTIRIGQRLRIPAS